MAKVLLDALSKEERGLERELGELVDNILLFLNLLLQEGSLELGRADGCSEDLDSVGANVVKGGGDGLGEVEEKGRGEGVEEVLDNTGGVGVVGEDGNVVEVGKEKEVAVTFEGSLEVFERLSNGEREEERGERIALSEAGGRGDAVDIHAVNNDDGGGLGVDEGGSLKQLGSMSSKGSGSVGSRGFVEGVGEIEGVEVLVVDGKVQVGCPLDRSHHWLDPSLGSHSHLLHQSMSSLL
jgi:hypothetical protein